MKTKKEKKALIKSIDEVDELIENVEKMINKFHYNQEFVPVWIEAYIDTLESLQSELLIELHKLEQEELRDCGEPKI